MLLRGRQQILQLVEILITSIIEYSNYRENGSDTCTYLKPNPLWNDLQNKVYYISTENIYG